MGIFGKVFKLNIGKMKKECDIDGLSKALGHSDPMVRQRATSAFEELINEWTSILGDKKIDVWPRRAAVIELLRRVSSKAKTNETLTKILRDLAVKPLIETLDDIEELPYGSRMLLLPGICQTLETVGDPRAIEPLRKVSKALEADERRMIKKTIERIQKR